LSGEEAVEIQRRIIPFGIPTPISLLETTYDSDSEFSDKLAVGHCSALLPAGLTPFYDDKVGKDYVDSSIPS
jgi:hypothetical protein